ncbi:MAG: IS3 family transposase [Jiangellaceae bacterium]
MSLATFVASQRDQHGVSHATSCRALGVSQAWFYKWRRGDVSLRRARREALTAAIRYWFFKRERRDGSPRITARLRGHGWQVSKNTVAQIMAEYGWVARPKRRRKNTTKPNKNHRKAPDQVKRDFSLRELPNQVWVGDVKDIPCAQGKFYLASVLDLHSRRCVGYATGAHHDTPLAKAALCMAIAVRGGRVAGVIMHTDQGGEYTGELFAAACTATGVTQSMGRTGSALDNAAAESFNSTVEFELLDNGDVVFATRELARAAIAAFIEDYNHERLHSTCGMLPPAAYEREQATLTKAA